MSLHTSGSFQPSALLKIISIRAGSPPQIISSSERILYLSGMRTSNIGVGNFPTSSAPLLNHDHLSGGGVFSHFICSGYAVFLGRSRLYAEKIPSVAREELELGKLRGGGGRGV